MFYVGNSIDHAKKLVAGLTLLGLMSWVTVLGYSWSRRAFRTSRDRAVSSTLAGQPVSRSATSLGEPTQSQADSESSGQFDYPGPGCDSVGSAGRGRITSVTIPASPEKPVLVTVKNCSSAIDNALKNETTGRYIAGASWEQEWPTGRQVFSRDVPVPEPFIITETTTLALYNDGFDTPATLHLSWKPAEPCPCKCPPGVAECLNESVDLSLSLGSSSFGETAGSLLLKSATPSPSLATPQSLVHYYVREGETKVINPQGTLRQLLSPQALADIVVINNFKYEVRFYARANAGAKDEGSGLYVPVGSPYQTVTIENPDASATVYNRLRISESIGSKTNEYIWSDEQQGWELATGNGERRESKSTVVDASTGDRLETSAVRNRDGKVVSKTVKRLRMFPGGEEVVQEIVDPDGAALTTTSSYDSTQSLDGVTYNRLRQMIQPTGYWERYEYDSNNRRTKVVAQYLDAPLGAPESASRVTTTTINLSEPQETIIETLLGQEVSRRYVILRAYETHEIQSQTPGAAANASDNLVTITRRYAGGEFVNEIQSMQNPDGSMSFYTYAISGNQKTTTVKTGQPNDAGSDIADGTRTVTVVDEGGNTLSETTYDISSGLLLTSAISTHFDEFGRPTRIEYNDGTFTTTVYGCCGIESTTDREGITTTYLYDDLKRVKKTTRAGITTRNTYDAEGRVLNSFRKGTDNSEIVVSKSTYDVAGRLATSEDALGNVTGFEETIDDNGHTVKTTTLPHPFDKTAAGSTRIETYAKDGSLLGVLGTGVHPLKYEYGVDADGRFTKEIRVGDGGVKTEWAKTYSDMLGRTYKTVFADGAVSQSFFNNKGQLIKQVDPDGVITLFAYNGKGEQEYAAVDKNRNGEIDFSGTDRITRTQSQVATKQVAANDTPVVQRTTSSVWTTNNINTAITIAINETSADGLRTWNTAFGLTTLTQTAYQPDAAKRRLTVNNPDGSSSVSEYQNGRLMSVIQKNSTGAQIARTAYTYDVLGRTQRTTDARTGKTSYSFDNADQLLSVTTPVPGSGMTAQMTSHLYDNLGRRTETTLSDKGKVGYEYYDTGELKKTFGARTYTAEYTYDSQGRLKTLLAGSGTTTWNYDQSRGFLNSKAYADGKGPKYAYTSAGRLKTRTWARGITTAYSYNKAGELSGIDYSDTTPDVSYVYDRRGRRTTTSGGVETLAVSYNDAGQPLVETHTGGPLDGVSVTHVYDSLLRRSSLQSARGSVLTNHTYTYDNASRLSTVSDGARSVTYGYVPNSSLVETLTFSQNDNLVMKTTKSYDKLNRLASISTRNAGQQTLNSFAYTYNDANQRTRVDLADGSYWLYGYDGLGQVTSGKKYFADDTPVAGQQFEYDFDNIGNRQTASAGGDPAGANLRTSEYAANSLNQYTQRTVPGGADVTGTAASDATVTVNNEPVYRKGEYFWKELLLDNSSSALLSKVKTVGVKNNAGPNGEDAVTEVTGDVFLPRTPELYHHDDDGNLDYDGRWDYTWDAENRLIEMVSMPDVPAAAKKKLEFIYDYEGRRVLKRVYEWNGTAFNAQPSTTLKFIYDGWNMIAELDGNNSIVNSYVWGLDLSGSIQGAGGVGGLLVMNSANAGSHFYTYDGNGNVTALADDNGVVVANYQYGPLGELIRGTGTMVEANSYRFSTKFQDDENGMLYYGYRYYNPSTGRWSSRDPIGEAGGINLFGFNHNDGVNRWDLLGMTYKKSCNWPENTKKWLEKACPFIKAFAERYKIDSKALANALAEENASQWLKDSVQDTLGMMHPGLGNLASQRANRGRSGDYGPANIHLESAQEVLGRRGWNNSTRNTLYYLETNEGTVDVGGQLLREAIDQTKTELAGVTDPNEQIALQTNAWREDLAKFKKRINDNKSKHNPSMGLYIPSSGNDPSCLQKRLEEIDKLLKGCEKCRLLF